MSFESVPCYRPALAGDYWLIIGKPGSTHPVNTAAFLLRDSHWPWWDLFVSARKKYQIGKLNFGKEMKSLILRGTVRLWRYKFSGGAATTRYYSFYGIRSTYGRLLQSAKCFIKHCNQHNLPVALPWHAFYRSGSSSQHSGRRWTGSIIVHQQGPSTSFR